MGSPADTETRHRPWRVLLLLATAELLGMSLWFTASAVAPELQALWDLSPSQAAAFTTVVQIGFVAGTGLAALLNLADVVPAGRLFVVADSAQFSALVTEVAPRHGVGTALTLQTSIGFLLSVATIQLVPVLVAAWGWPWAFPVLALGPAAGIAAIRRLAD